MTRLCTILARGGSKGVKDKNIRPLAGKPLVVHTLDQAKACGLFDLVAVSSDDRRILDIAAEAGADLVGERPAALAGDAAAKLPAIRHCLEEAERRSGLTFDEIVDLAVTSPLRAAEDIAGAIARREEAKAPNVVSANASAHSPYFNIAELDSANRIRICKPLEGPLMLRQDAPETYDINGAVYVWTRAALDACGEEVLLDDTALFVMPRARSVDIDTELDFEIARFLKHRGNKP